MVDCGRGGEEPDAKTEAFEYRTIEVSVHVGMTKASSDTNHSAVIHAL